MDTRPPLRQQPLALLAVGLGVAGVVLVVSGRFVAGLGLISAGTLASTALLLRTQIRAGDERARARRRQCAGRPIWVIGPGMPGG